jgi:transcriptional regulator with XRE-family HTH domain
MNKKDYTDLQEKFGAHLQQLREKKGMSLREVAQNCELDDSNISKIEHGRFNVQLSTIVELAKGLEVQASELLKFKYD